jgi:hypothetical protein
MLRSVHAYGQFSAGGSQARGEPVSEKILRGGEAWEARQILPIGPDRNFANAKMSPKAGPGARPAVAGRAGARCRNPFRWSPGGHWRSLAEPRIAIKLLILCKK